MNASLVGFGLLAAISVGTALGVVLHKNPVRSALFLVVNFICLALLYYSLNAHLLAVLQILVYAGAIMVLFLFVIMLLNLGGETAPEDPLAGQRLVGLLLGLGLLTGLVYGINYSADRAQLVGASAERVARAHEEGLSQIQIIGWDLFTRYVYPFELTSILLLVGVIGVIIFTKHRAERTPPDASS